MIPGIVLGLQSGYWLAGVLTVAAAVIVVVVMFMASKSGPGEQ